MNTKHFLRAVIAILSLVAAAPASAQCMGDIVEDGKVDGGDLGVLLANWGLRTSSAWSIASDLDNSGAIDGADLGILLSNWGACPSPAWATVIEFQPDPSVVTNPALRAAIAATGLPWRVRDRGTGIEMMLIPPIEFQMGCGSTLQGACPDIELPVHQVAITNAFFLGRYEVTQAQWTAKLGSNPSQFQGDPTSGACPVESVTWEMVQGFLAQSGMRLPTEAEWEGACRAGTTTVFHGTAQYPAGFNSADLLGTIAWFNNGSGAGKPQRVGLKSANGFGLYDMSGNVWEWVNDWFGSAYYSSSPGINPAGPATGGYHVVRGGGYSDEAYYSRASCRHTIQPGGSALCTVGFRVARNP